MKRIRISENMYFLKYLNLNKYINICLSTKPKRGEEAKP